MIVLGPRIKNCDDNCSRALINGNFRKATIAVNSRDQWKGGTQISNLILNLFAI